MFAQRVSGSQYVGKSGDTSQLGCDQLSRGSFNIGEAACRDKQNPSRGVELLNLPLNRRIFCVAQFGHVLSRPPSKSVSVRSGLVGTTGGGFHVVTSRKMQALESVRIVRATASAKAHPIAPAGESLG